MAITRSLRAVRDFARDVRAFRPRLPDAEEAIWTPEEQADFERWERDFEEPIEDAEHEAWLAWAEAVLTWHGPVPSC